MTLSDFQYGMVLGAKRTGLSILLLYWDLHIQTSLGFIDNGPKKRKCPVSNCSQGENSFLMSEVREE